MTALKIPGETPDSDPKYRVASIAPTAIRKKAAARILKANLEIVCISKETGQTRYYYDPSFRALLTCASIAAHLGVIRLRLL